MLLFLDRSEDPLNLLKNLSFYNTHNKKTRVTQKSSSISFYFRIFAMTAGMRDKNTFSFAKLSSKVGALCGGFKLSVVGINPLTP